MKSISGRHAKGRLQSNWCWGGNLRSEDRDVVQLKDIKPRYFALGFVYGNVLMWFSLKVLDIINKIDNDSGCLDFKVLFSINPISLINTIIIIT